MNRTQALFGTALLLLLGALGLDLWPKGAEISRPPPRAVAGTEVPPAPPPTLDPSGQRLVQLGEEVRLEGVLSHENLLAHGQRELFLRFGLEAHRSAVGERAPVAVAIVLDRSGSMAGDKIVKARDAAKGIVGRLGPRDRVAVVSYATDYSVDLPLTAVTQANRDHVLRVIDEVLDGGGTNLSGGLEAGLSQLAGLAREGFVTRVLLMSDGNANQGITDPAVLNRRARAAREAGVTISSLGIGVDFNEDLMSGLAESAGGAYYYARQGSDIVAALNQEFDGLESLAAQQVSVGLELASGVRIAEAFGYELQNDGGPTRLLVGDMRSGERRQVVLRLTVDAGAAGPRPITGVSLDYGLEHGTRRQFQGALTARVVDDAARVEDGVRTDVLEAAHEATAANERARAVRAFESGDKSRAEATLEQQLQDTRRAAARLGSAALLDQAQQIENAIQNIRSFEASSERGRDLIKSEKLETRRAQRY